MIVTREDQQDEGQGGSPRALDEPVLGLADVVEDLHGQGVHPLARRRCFIP